eukprot:SAG31_NODE_4144_length_3504_cov_7.703276_1_plen_52_part_00
MCLQQLMLELFKNRSKADKTSAAFAIVFKKFVREARLTLRVAEVDYCAVVL